MKEIEIKILEINVEKIEQKLLELGAKKLEECKIHDVIFDFPDNRIYEKKELLRVRNHENRVEITYKANPAEGEFLEHDEYETTVQDFDTAVKIMKLIGLVVTCDREKKRVTYQIGNTKFEFDTYPGIPTYMEIEGSKEEIQKMLEKLGYTMKDATNMNATQVIEQYKKDPSNLKFEK